MNKERLILPIGVISFILLMLALVFSAGVGITITKPLNQSYNYINHTINVTSSATASSCRYLVNATVQGQIWVQAAASAGWAARYGHTIAVAPNGTMWLAAGYDGTTFYNDVWYSTDGATWTRANASAAFESRYGHGFVMKSDGSMWIMGGLNSAGSKLNDVWNSTNGVDWTLVNSSVAWENRSLLQAVITSNNIMWVMGGQNNSGSNFILGDVWNSSNGADWKLVNSTAFLGRREYTAVAGVNNRMWVMGGYIESGSYLNDVRYSDNGLTWQEPNASSAIPWGIRKSHAAAFTPSDGRIWVSGGYNPDTAGYRNDVWYSQDGANWTQAASSALWTARQDHQLAVMKNGTMIIAGGYYGANLNDVWLSSAPVSMEGTGTTWGKAFNASEGSNFIGVECNDSTNMWNSSNVSFYVDTALPVITISNPLNTTYNGTSIPVAANATVSETASTCLSSLNGAANLTMNGSGTTWGITLAFAEGSNRIAITCNDTINWWNSSSISFFLDTIKPVLNITRPFNQTYTYTNLTVNVTTNESAQICRYAHNVTYEQNWTLLNASAFSARRGHTITNLNGTLWLIGGYKTVTICSPECVATNIYLNDTWNSTDGISWTQANASTAFAERADHASVATSDGKLWVIAGYDGTNYYNDSWYSTNGANWIRANNSIFAERSAHASVVDSSGRIWVFGGVSPAAAGGGLGFGAMAGGPSVAPLNDTWYSTDGGNWTRANASTGIASRSYAKMAATSDGRIWIIGGKNSADTALNDAWHSSDGANWTRATSSAEWPARYGHISFSTPDDRIWAVGGTLDGTTFYNDVWYSGNGTGWKIVNSTTNSSFWTTRAYFGGAVKGENIYIAGGHGSDAELHNDSWSTPIPPWYRDMDGSGITWGKNFTAAHGNNNVKVRCWDIAGNLNSSMQWFSVNLCGNNICDTGETTASCPADCPAGAAQTSTGSSSASTGGGASTKITTDFNNLKAGIETEKKLLDLKTSLTTIAITSKKDIASLTMSIEKIENMPDYAKNLNGKIYEFLDIKLDKEAELKAKICFSVEEQWISEQEMQKEDVVLAHYNPKIIYKLKPGTISEKEMTLNFVTEEQDWEELPTQIVKSEETKTEYCSEAKAFSPYAIVAKKQDIQEFLTVIRPVVEEQIIAGNAVKVKRAINWRTLRDIITGSIDAVLILFVFILIMFGDRIFPEGINISVPEIKMPSIESMLPVPKPPELKLPAVHSLPAELTKSPAKHEFAPNYKTILVAFTKDSLLKGYAESEIREKMEEHGMENEDINKIITESHAKICSMSKDELLPHVLDAVIIGCSFAEISASFAKQGISVECISSVIKMARSEISKSSGKTLLPFAKKCLIKRMPAIEIINLLVKHGVNKTSAEKLVNRAHSILKKQKHLK